LDPKFDHDLTHITEFAIDESRKAYRIVQADGSTSDICLVVDYDNIIGAGSQGIVYRGTFGKDTPAAVKVINIFHPDSVSFHTVDQLLKELRLLKAVAPHPTIVKYFMCAVCSRPDRAFLVLEYCEHGDLWRYMETLREAGVPFTVSRKLELILDVTTAVAWLHCLPKPVLHGDLKASNVLVGNDGKAKVADFGISVLLEGSFSVSAAKTNRMTGTPAYLAPEMWEDTYRRSRAQDVYALGVLLWEVMHETKPWEGEPLLRVSTRCPYVLHTMNTYHTLSGYAAGGFWQTPKDSPRP
jgi:serine/threonine protein kinase